MMALLALSLPMSLTACNTAPIRINPVSAVFIPDSIFVCLPKPTKPDKVFDEKSGVWSYKNSDAGRLLDQTELARADCETQLHAAKEIYQKQLDAAKTGVDGKPLPD